MDATGCAAGRTTSTVLGVSADYHDAAAALVVDGRIVAATQEERFSRVKHDPSLPRSAIEWCLDVGGIGAGEVDVVVFHEKPLTALERTLVTHGRVGPRGVRNLTRALGAQTGRKVWIGYRMERLLTELRQGRPALRYAEHHQSHAASAFYPSPFSTAAILTLDGVGEWATGAISWGGGSRIEVRREMRYPDSIGLFYSALTAFCGFAVNDGEARLMGLAPYGEPRFAPALRDHVIRVHPDGSIALDQRYFDYQAGRAMAHRRLAALLGGPPRPPGHELDQRHADIARSAQDILEDVVVLACRHAREITGERRLCLAGGVALNCVANQRVVESAIFDDVWIQPAAGDDGAALGAALWAHHLGGDRPRIHDEAGDAMCGAALGPGFSQGEVVSALRAAGLCFDRFDDTTAFVELVAAELETGKIVGWFDGRMEFGPRALGHRSILADPRDPAVTRRLNDRVKRREGFRPFAPAVLSEEASAWFDLEGSSPYMLRTATVRSTVLPDGTDRGAPFAERLAAVDSPLPACTHVDGSARVQTVDARVHPTFHRLLSAFHRRTGCPVLLNTSFNGNHEPIVRSPTDAVASFRRCGLDLLAIEGCLVRATDADLR